MKISLILAWLRMSRVEVSRADIAVIEKIRVDLNMSKTEFAKKIGMTRRNYAYLLTGERSSISSSVLATIRSYGGSYDDYARSLLRDRINQAMKDYKITITELNKELDYHYSTIANMLSVEADYPPSINKLQEIAQAIIKVVNKKLSKQFEVSNENNKP